MFTGESACIARSISRLEKPKMKPHCINSHHRSTDIIRWHYGPRDENATVINGMLVASPARTICDLAAEDSAESLLVSINYCLHKKLFTKEGLLEEMGKLPGMRRAKLIRSLLPIATDKCESVLETIAWIALYKAQFVMPTQQLNIYDHHNFIARVDMCWELPKRNVVLELDGKLKYIDPEVLYAEKRREDAIRDLEYKVVRASWSDVEDGTLVKRLEKIKIPKRRYFGQKFPVGNRKYIPAGSNHI
jgi:hypothetical protein